MGYQECAHVPRDASFPVSSGKYRRKPDPLCTTWDRSYVQTISSCVGCRQSRSPCRSRPCFVKRTFGVNTLRQLSPCHHPKMGRMRKIHLDHFAANSIFNLVTESSVNWSPFSRNHARFGRWGHQVHNRSAVRDSVSFVSCSTSCACLCVSLWRIVNRRHIFSALEGSVLLRQKLSPPAQGVRMKQRSHSA